MSTESAAPYNIVLIMTDQHRVDHAGFIPGSRLETPHLDRLADSVAFASCLTANPICTPARAALLTGKYTHQIGMLDMSGDLSLEHPTYMRALQGAGYWTAGVGKFHWMQNWPWGIPRGTGHDLVALKREVMRYGLDYAWEVAGKQLAVHNRCEYGARLAGKGLLERYRDHVIGQGPNAQDPSVTRFTGEPWPFDEAEYVDNVIGDEALRALDARPADRPFFLFASFCGPHKPYDPPRSWLEQFPLEEVDDFLPGAAPLTPEARQRVWRLRRAYKAMIALIDWQVGRLLHKLEADGLLERTVLLFTSDHGEMLGDHGRMSKQQPWRQSVTVPTAIRHPAHPGRRLCTAPVELTDLTATMLDVAGLDPATALSKPWPAYHNRVPCRSLMPVVRGESDGVREVAFSECRNQWELLQSRDWKYVRELPGSPRGAGERLFSLSADPGEQHDRSADPVCRDLLAGFRERRQALMDATPSAQLGWAPWGGER